MKKLSSKMYVYALTDLSNNVFYVGQSKDPYVRLLNHISKSYLLKTEKDKIINEICKSGIFPKFKILEEIIVDLNDKKSIFNVSDRESYWINQFSHLSNLQKRRIKLKFEEIPENSPKCEYCNHKMQKGTAKKRFCSAKCRVYFSREPKSGGNITVEFKKLDKIAPNLGVSKPKPNNVTKLHKNSVELTLNGQPEPPEGLVGIDLAIWKSENWK